MRVIANVGGANVPLPADAEVLVCSEDVDLGGGYRRTARRGFADLRSAP